MAFGERFRGHVALEFWAELGGLFGIAFLSATLLPGGSEIAFVALAVKGDIGLELLVLAATLGNSLGGMSSWLIGRLLAPGQPCSANVERALGRIRRFGAPLLLAGWVPFVGDPLCLAAGWTRIAWVPALTYITLGKALRYGGLALLV